MVTNRNLVFWEDMNQDALWINNLRFQVNDNSLYSIIGLVFSGESFNINEILGS